MSGSAGIFWDFFGIFGIFWDYSRVLTPCEKYSLTFKKITTKISVAATQHTQLCRIQKISLVCPDSIL
jgi:hypothetical protein